MSNSSSANQDRMIGPGSLTTNEPAESFGDILSQYEQSHKHRPETGEKGLQGTIIAVSGDSVYLDVGYKIEGTVPLEGFQGVPVKPGDVFPVSIKGRGADGYYELSLLKVERPRDWSSLEKAFADKA